MLEYNKIDISKGIDVNKTSPSKGYHNMSEKKGETKRISKKLSWGEKVFL